MCIQSNPPGMRIAFFFVSLKYIESHVSLFLRSTRKKQTKPDQRCVYRNQREVVKNQERTNLPHGNPEKKNLPRIGYSSTSDQSKVNTFTTLLRRRRGNTYRSQEISNFRSDVWRRRGRCRRTRDGDNGSRASSRASRTINTKTQSDILNTTLLSSTSFPFSKPRVSRVSRV
jgi:hypothetical protein